MQWWQNIMPICSEKNQIAMSYQNKKKTLDIDHSIQLKENENVLLVRKRKSRIFYNKSFFDYPISLNFQNLVKLGLWNSILIGISYSKAAVFPIKNIKTLEEFFIDRFGKRLYKTFFKDYTEKV